MMQVRRICLGLGFVGVANAMNFGGVTLKDSVKSPAPLTLNGMDVRQKNVPLLPFPVDVYVIGMYLNEKLNPATSVESRIDQAMDPARTKRFDLVLKMNLSAKKMNKGIEDGYATNCPPTAQNKLPCRTLTDSFAQLKSFITGIDEFKEGDHFSLEITPTGVKVMLTRKDQVELEEKIQSGKLKKQAIDRMETTISNPSFAAFLPALWLKKPPDGQKSIPIRLVGGESTAPSQETTQDQRPSVQHLKR